MKPTILVVDDEKDLVNLVRYNLQKEEYNVICAYDGSSVLELVWAKRPDLIILDLMLPDRSGFDICKEIKENPQLKATPIIMLTARSSEYDRIKGFESGAEDYVVKPFSPKELILRVKAMLSRTRQVTPEKIQLGRLVIFPEQYKVLVGDEEIHLTHTEFRILLTLAKQPNIVKTREQLLHDVWQDSADEILDRAVDAQVKRLRAKLGSERDSIETVRGIGYRLISQAPMPSPANHPVSW